MVMELNGKVRIGVMVSQNGKKWERSENSRLVWTKKNACGSMTARRPSLPGPRRQPKAGGVARASQVWGKRAAAFTTLK
ncbi:hypothetical protein [Massilia sp. TSP1-1-2]|uniref:hypothetical protein n=1 Tax=Massilia sp. TSP1-1-2 TaxID=2804649 RepID=UPI003CEDC242